VRTAERRRAARCMRPGAMANPCNTTCPTQVRPLNNRERDEGLRSCVAFDEPSRQVVLQVSGTRSVLCEPHTWLVAPRLQLRRGGCHSDISRQDVDRENETNPKARRRQQRAAGGAWCSPQRLGMHSRKTGIWACACSLR
jgi:hypothetical protein